MIGGGHSRFDGAQGQSGQAILLNFPQSFEAPTVVIWQDRTDLPEAALSANGFLCPGHTALPETLVTRMA